MIDLNTLPMRIAVGQSSELTDEYLTFAKQCGAEDVQLNTPRIPGEARWEVADLKALVNKAAEYDLRLICLENTPIAFYDQIMIGGEGRDRQLENMTATIRNMAEAGIPILGYHWMPNGVWRTEWEAKVRGGAISNGFCHAQTIDKPLTHGRVYTEAEMWDNYDWYMERILPVCEAVGVRMALHPDDPPVPTLGGVARLFRNFDNFKRALDTHNSPMHGLDFCHGCWSEMRGGAGVLEAIEYFGSRKRLFYIHLRDVIGDIEDFTEVFLGDGNSDIVAVIKKLRAVGFNGFLLDDHVPHMVNDVGYAYRGRSYAMGYISGMMRALPAA